MNVKMVESSGLCVMCTANDTNWIDEEGDRICEFCQDESEYKRSVVELRQRAEAAEARTAQLEGALETSGKMLRTTEAERDELRRKLEQAQREITEHRLMLESLVKAVVQ